MIKKSVSLDCIFLLILTLAQVGASQEFGKLIMIQELFRHGARYPTDALNIGGSFIKRQGLLGELTAQGKSMHYLLGNKMYEVYWDKLFAGTPFQYRYNQSKFHVRSTNFNRTIESAQSHMIGIMSNLPPLNISAADVPYSAPRYPGIKAKEGNVYGEFGAHIHPIPVHTTQKDMTAFQDGDFLARWDQKNCPKMNVWGKQNYKSPQAKKVFSNKRFIAALQQFSKALNKTMTMEQFYDYYDALICLHYAGIEVPPIMYAPSETQKALEDLYILINYIYYFGNEDQIRAQSSDIIAATINNMKRAQKDLYSSPQWVMYSAHDLSIASIFAITGLWNFDCLYKTFTESNYESEKCLATFPTFASDLIFQLYQYKSGTYTFKMNYNGKYLPITFCNYESECAVQKLEAFYEGWKVKNIRALCGAPYYYTKEMLYILAGTISSLLIWFISMKLRLKETPQGSFLHDRSKKHD